MYVAWLGFQPQTTHDYGLDFARSGDALLGGHLRAFFELAPADGAVGSLVLRLPGALLGKWLVGSQLAIFRFGALECVLALAALGLWLAARLRDAGQGLAGQIAVVAACVLAPHVLDAILFGHPEEALGAALSVGAVLAAASERPALAGALLGAAVIDKPWGVIAAAPALIACPPGRRLVLCAWATAPVAAFGLLGLALAGSRFLDQFGGAAVVAHPQSLWWPLSRGEVLASGARYHLVPAFLAEHGRQLAVLVPLLGAAVLLIRGARDAGSCLALLAAGFAARLLLDPSNHVYYAVPFVSALVAWDAHAVRPPVAGLLALGLTWLAFHTVASGSLMVQFWFYLVVMLGFLGVLGAALVGRDPPGSGRARALLSARFGMIRG